MYPEQQDQQRRHQRATTDPGQSDYTPDHETRHHFRPRHMASIPRDRRSAPPAPEIAIIERMEPPTTSNDEWQTRNRHTQIE